MKSYYRVMLGKGSAFASQGIEGGYIGVDFDIPRDLSGSLPDQWRDFNKKYIPSWFEKNPGKSKVAAGLACGMLWTVSKGIAVGDIVMTPDGKGTYFVGEVIGEYQYREGDALPHQRPVRWFSKAISRADMSDALQHSSGAIGTVCNLTSYADEIEKFLDGANTPQIVAMDETIEDPSTFALEKHLEDFLVQNWSHTALGKEYDIYKEDTEIVGQQYPTDTGSIDILAISKDKLTLLIVELKKGRASDNVVGQLLRYMGYVKDELAEANQTVKGVIIAMEDDQRLRRALSVAPNVDYYRYQVTFKLTKG